MKPSRPSRARGLKLPCRNDAATTGDVAPLAGAWIETDAVMGDNMRLKESRPSRARGLKQRLPAPIPARRWSRPSRARGLKRPGVQPAAGRDRVAPLAGAWIETLTRPPGSTGLALVAPLAGAWIETMVWRSRCARSAVAPLAGAWIETPGGGRSRNDRASRPSRARGLKQGARGRPDRRAGSRPSRARGLKPEGDEALRADLHVAPLAGAWIETCGRCGRCRPVSSRAPRGRVD